MKVLVITERIGHHSGWERYSYELISDLLTMGCEVKAAVNKRSEIIPISQSEILAPALSMLSRYYLSFLPNFKLMRLIHSFKPDRILILVEPYAALFCFWPRQKIPLILVAHGTYAVAGFHGGPINRFLIHRYLKLMSRVLCVSNFTQTLLLDTIRKSQREHLVKRTFVVHNGVRNPYPVLDSTHKKKNAVKQILFVGALKERKGILELLEATYQFKINNPLPFTLQMVGSYNPKSSYFKKIQNKIKELQLENTVRIRGKISEEELQNCYQIADLFIMLSTRIGHNFEGFGLVYLEANAKGIPVIGSNSGGVPEAIRDGYSGYTCNPQNSQQVAKKISAILVQNKLKSDDCISWARSHDFKLTSHSVMSHMQEVVNSQLIKLSQISVPIQRRHNKIQDMTRSRTPSELLNIVRGFSRDFF